MSSSVPLTSVRTTPAQFSVVIASWNGCQDLSECLASLGDDASNPDTEIIVVTNFDSGVREMLKARHRSVIHIAMPGDTQVPMLRSAGVQHATGAIVSLAEDHCRFGENWCVEMRQAHRGEYSVVGGAVENAKTASALDWAVFLHDYGRFMLPARPGVVDSLAGNNVSYKRDALRAIWPALEGGISEVFFHGELLRHGYPLFFTPSAVVHHVKNYSLAPLVTKSFHLARSFAGQRVLRASRGKRYLLSLGSFALPVLLPLRIVLCTLRKGRNIVPMLRSLPLILFLMMVWFAGEFSGYVSGQGESARHWK